MVVLEFDDKNRDAFFFCVQYSYDLIGTLWLLCFVTTFQHRDHIGIKKI